MNATVRLPALLATALLPAAPAATAMTITGYSSTTNDRFSSGYPLAPVENADPSFIGAGLDWSGVGWAANDATKSFGFLSPQHYLVARHYGGASTIRLFANGSVQSFTQSSVEATGYGVVFQNQTLGDLSLGTLNRPVPSSTSLPRYAVLDLNSTSSANSPENYDIDLLLYGRGPNGATSTRIGATPVIGYFLDGNYQGIFTHRDDVQLQGGDSGSPAFHRWTNPAGGAELTLIGNHAGINVEEGINAINFLGTVEVMTDLNAKMNNEGFALRVVGNPTHTWVGTSNTDLNDRASWGLPLFSSAPSDTFVTFDAATAGSDRVVTVNADHNLRGLYFKPTAASSDGFSFTGEGTLTIGRGGITNYDNSRQTFTADIALGSAQYWDGGSGGITTGDITTNGRLLEITGTGTNRIEGVVSGTGGIAVSGGLLEITGANTYSGTTWVHAGELTLNNPGGSATGSGTLHVAAGARLSGAGATNSSTTISGSVAPGNSIGTLTIGNSVTWNAGDDWLFELGLPAGSLAAATAGESLQDLLLISGGGFLKGTGTGWSFDFANTGAPGWYRLVDWDGSTTFNSGDFTALNLAGGAEGQFLIDAPTSALYFRVIPEPSTALLSTLALAIPLLRRRRLR